MLNDEARSLKALSIALDRLQAMPDEQTQLELNQAVKQLRLIVRQCSPLLEFYNEALDQLQENPDSPPRNKFISSQTQSDRDRADGASPQETATAKRPSENKPGLHPDVFTIGDDFDAPLSDVQVKHSILELEGLGKALWQGIDAQQYVDQERDSWNG
jgi:hypothetical protein